MLCLAVLGLLSRKISVTAFAPIPPSSSARPGKLQPSQQYLHDDGRQAFPSYQHDWAQRSRERRHATPTTICHLFFRAREDKKRKEAQAKIPASALEGLRRKDVSIPFQFPLVLPPQGNDNAAVGATPKVVTIRYLTVEDLSAIVPLCVAEFGGGEMTFQDFVDFFPWDRSPADMKEYVVDWWDNFILPSFVYWTFLWKIAAYNNSHGERPQDHALLVATLQQEKQPEIVDFATTATEITKQLSTITGNDNNDAVIVGMVELSRQPPEANRNPPAYPLPLWYKTAYCNMKQLPPLNGWVTNLLVGPDFRGQGYSKLLMAATEGVARSWGCNMIHLHCDANSIGGKVPQTLYKGLGYEMVEDPNSPYAWMGSELSTKIFMIQGVALLYFRKAL